MENGAVNLILLFDEDFVSESIVVLRGRRLRHLREIHRASVGDELIVGRAGGRRGRGRVLTLSEDHAELETILLLPCR